MSELPPFTSYFASKGQPPIEDRVYSSDRQLIYTLERYEFTKQSLEVRASGSAN